MSVHGSSFTPWLVVLVAACGASDAGPTLNHYGDEMAGSVEVVAEALSVHHTQILAETNLDRIRQMEVAHAEGMDMDMGRMQDAGDSMASCSEHMGTMNLVRAPQSFHDAQAAMSEVMSEVTTEQDRHMNAMSQAADLDDALAEERQHRGVMDGMVDRMRMHDDALGLAMQQMQDEGLSMMCSMSSHMHGHH